MTNEGQNLQLLLQKLVIPLDISRLEGLQESPLLLKIEQWKATLTSNLSETLALLSIEEESLGMDEKANVVFVLLPFIPSDLWLRARRDGPSISMDDWSTARSFSIAQGKSDSLLPLRILH
jgi:hypothetical protein